MALTSGFASPVKINHNTLKVSRGKFARVCVEINLNKLVKGIVCVEGQWMKIEYEGLHIIYTNCGCHSHNSRDYAIQKVSVMVEKVDNIHQLPP